MVAFTVVEHDYNFMLDVEKTESLLAASVLKADFNMDVLVLGLRNLQSPGVLPIKKAFIKFNVKSIVPPGSAAVEDKYTQPTSAGPNPTINTTINIHLPLPKEALYCPNLTCFVYD